MKIRRPKNLTVPQIAVTIVAGILSGIYIYKPFFVGPEKIVVDKGRIYNFSFKNFH